MSTIALAGITNGRQLELQKVPFLSMNLPAFPKHLEIEKPDVGTRTARAFDRLRGQLVAVKWGTTRMQAQGLAREWKYLHRLSPRFVPPPIEFSRPGEREAFLTATWLDGKPLDAFLRDADAQSQAAAVLDALAGLDHLHGAGLCHRDVRTRNLLIVSGAAGPRARWLDFDHAVAEGMLEAATSYVGGRGMGEDRGNDAFPSQDDVRQFCVALAHTLEGVAENPAVKVLKAFAARAQSVFYLDEMPHGRAAWTILREMLLEAKLAVPTDCSALGVSRFVPRKDVEREWRARIGSEAGRGGVLLVHGAAGIGKRAFLASAAADLAADGAHVVNLLGYAKPSFESLDVSGGDGKRRILLLDSDSQTDGDPVRGILAAGWQVIVAQDSDNPSTVKAWQKAGATVNSWAFPSFGARDWYRWIAASV